MNYGGYCITAPADKLIDWPYLLGRSSSSENNPVLLKLADKPLNPAASFDQGAGLI